MGRLDAGNAQTLFSRYDIVVDGSDNFETRYLAADTAEHLQITLVTGAVGRFDGSLTVLQPWKTQAMASRTRPTAISFPPRRRRASCPAVRRPASSAR